MFWLICVCLIIVGIGGLALIIRSFAYGGIYPMSALGLIGVFICLACFGAAAQMIAHRNRVDRSDATVTFVKIKNGSAVNIDTTSYNGDLHTDVTCVTINNLNCKKLTRGDHVELKESWNSMGFGHRLVISRIIK